MGGFSIPASNIWNIISSQNAAASSALNFEFDYSEYSQYQFMFTDIVLSADSELQLRVGTGTGPVVYDSGNNYDFAILWNYGTAGTGTSSRAFVSATSMIRLGTIATVSSALGKPLVGVCLLDGFLAGANLRVGLGQSNFDGGAGLTKVDYLGIHNTTALITGLRVFPSAGNITSGNVLLLGRK